jgi:hypothetical protein
MAAFTWHGSATTTDVVNAGPLALIQPLLDQLDLEALIDRHLPYDPQQEYSHGHVLSVLLAARLCQPTALVNIDRWAADSGADVLWNIPADKLNDDRLGRALDAFFDHRHSIFGRRRHGAAFIDYCWKGKLNERAFFSAAIQDPKADPAANR